ncbi:single-stranded-DNA-specific exonuclease RecJ [Chlamydiifrater phoenicopteri]|uniref:single-stranded-DNA-specific exonuclease RecJ n=1 Tax=Chlamydiifrater phoenicopteri TaxID=2681469 RepID=UPI001BD04836|nr:single-stranded-DNA-specific exonuclease RecJ [Chlamydiifrater phoenicopteri]
MKAKDWEICWVPPKEDVSCSRTLTKAFNLHPVLSKVFIARGMKDVSSVRRFLYPNLSECSSPFGLPNIAEAVGRILRARRNQEKILVYGDNDVDGMTSVALLVEFFQLLHMDVEYAFSGLSLNPLQASLALVAKVQEKKANLIVTVDWGTTAAKEISAVKNLDVDVVVTDHHEIIGKVPKEVLIVNPKISQDYPNQELTGVGVAFQLAVATLQSLVASGDLPKNHIDVYKFLDLVALGTIADVGELVGENRIFVSHGITLIRKGRRLGLRRLLEVLKINIDSVTAADLALKVAPKLNSLGRLSNPEKGAELLLSIDSIKAVQLVKQICEIDRDRRELERKISQDVERVLKDNPEEGRKAALVLASDTWHPRIVPIISAKFSKLYNRPVVIVSFSGEIGKGSARTHSNFPLLKVLKKCSESFLSFGGHNLAVGLSIRRKDFASFKKKFIHLVQSSSQKKHRKESLFLDAEVDFSSLTYELLSSVELLEPFGRGNPSPVFFTTARQYRLPKLVAGSHIKVFLENKGRHFEGVLFSMESRLKELQSASNKELKVAYTPRIISSPFLGEVVQLLVRDFTF